MVKTKDRVRAPQKRQLERVAILLDCAEQILANKSIEEFGLAELSDLTGIALQSIYYYYPNKFSILEALAQRVHAQWVDDLKNDVLRPGETWQQLIGRVINNGARELNNNPAAMKLLLGAGSTIEVRMADLSNNRALAVQIGYLLEKRFIFVANDYYIDKLAVCMAMLDGIWQASFSASMSISQEIADEAVIALTSYLRAYLPEYLPER